MNAVSDPPLPSILWVASRAPLPPFDGPTLKAYSGITALSDVTDVQILTFAESGCREGMSRRLREYWVQQGRPLTEIEALDYDPPAGMTESLLKRRFLFGSRVMTPALMHRLDLMTQSDPDRLIVFDDIVFAPLAARYGDRVLFSPHDCVSALLRSSARNASTRAQALKAWTQSQIAREYEQRFYHQFLLNHLVTHQDSFLLQQINARARYHVVPNSPLYGPLTAPPDRFDWDLVIWADLRRPPSQQGVRLFLREMRAVAPHPFQTAVVGRVPPDEAKRLIGAKLLETVVYQPFLEDDAGRIRHGKVTLIPDIGGAGIKNRALNVLAAHKCLACLYSQMDGLETFCDTGAINAFTMPELFLNIKCALREESYARIAEAAETLFKREFSPGNLKQQWVEMIQRAVCVRRANL